MPTATVTFDPATSSTLLNGHRSPEPDGWRGALATAALYAALGYNVTVRRARPAEVTR